MSGWSEGKGRATTEPTRGHQDPKSPQPHFKQTRKAERQLSTSGPSWCESDLYKNIWYGSFDAKAQGAGEVNSQGTLAVGVLGHARLGMVSRTMGLEWRELGYWNPT